MEELGGREVTPGDLQKFSNQLHEYEMCKLRSLYNYFQKDLIYIIELLDARRILTELSRHWQSRDIEHYLSLKEQLGDTFFAAQLVDDIHRAGKHALIGLFVSLYAIQKDYPYPNVLGVLDEIRHAGNAETPESDSLLQMIDLDEHGPDLPDDLKAVQAMHKQKLLEETQNLEEHRTPGSTRGRRSLVISKWYLDLIVVSGDRFRNRTQHEVIETGVIHEHYLQEVRTKLERISLDKLFRWCHRSARIPHAVLVSGVPGVGKTTMTQKFVYDWADGKLYQRFSFVFLFKFRNLNALPDLSLEALILRDYPHLTDKLSQILKYPKNLLFVFDGLDESVHTVNFKSSHLLGSPRSPGDVLVLVVSLVRQSLLKGCSVLITSRPTNLVMIETDAFPRVSEIMGFFPKERQDYFDNFFRDKALSAKAFNYVRQNDLLYTFCYIPSYCWIICTVLSTYVRENREFALKTVTQLFVTFVANILSNHIIRDCSLQEVLTLGWMAEHGVMEHKLTFDKRDLDTFCIDLSKHLSSAFLVESLQTSDQTVSFSHLTIQEFLAALVNYLDYSREKFQESLERAKGFEDGRGEIFLRFLCGLSDSSTRFPFERLRNEFSNEAARHAITWLRDSVLQDMQSCGETEDKRKILNTFACLFETRNKALVAQCLGSNRRLELSMFYLSPLDCTVLAFILESWQGFELLDLDRCFIQREGLERICPTLHKITELKLSNNTLTDNDVELIYQILTNPKCKIQSLSLKSNVLTIKCLSVLASALCATQSLQKLDLGNNRLGGEDLEHLMTVLSSPTCRIQHLSLQATKLTHEHAPLLVSLANNSNLTHLNLSGNYFADPGALDIRDLIRKSTSLLEVRLGSNDFSGDVENGLKALQGLRPGLEIIL